jgi:DNA polymerase III alpha subunit
MSTIFIDLEDRVVTDSGNVVAKHSLLVKKALSGEVFTNLPAVPHPDITRYNHKTEKRPVDLWEDNSEFEGPPESSYEWTIPPEYKKLNIEELAVNKMVEMGLTDEAYIERLSFELEAMKERDMIPFIRCLVYTIDRFRKKGVVWGIGRGSSCASLVLFVLGVNRVDPVKYDIPRKEFFK